MLEKGVFNGIKLDSRFKIPGFFFNFPRLMFFSWWCHSDLFHVYPNPYTWMSPADSS